MPFSSIFVYGRDSAIILWVHDEIVVKCRPEIADEVGEMLVRHAVEPADFYGLCCPLSAEYNVANNWNGETGEEAVKAVAAV